MISYAQAKEDVLLDRALRHVPPTEGFYIDVGAYHPANDSVTKHFYDQGWRGINIEPSALLYGAFPEQRPRDINLQAAISDRAGEVTFHEVEGQLGTLEAKFAARHAAAGLATRSYTVPATTLSEVCATHARGAIHFLKIDIEGHEAAAIRGMDFTRFRPWILVIESVEPNNLAAPTYGEWDGMVVSAGYSLAYTDVLNRYYVAHEQAQLTAHFSVPADDYHQAWILRQLVAWRERAQHAEARLAQLER